MARLFLPFIFSVLALGLCKAQQSDSLKFQKEDIADSVSFMKTDSVQAIKSSADTTIAVRKRAIQPSFYLDYGKLLTLPTAFESKYEGGAALLIASRIAIIAEAGKATLTPEGAYANGVYKSEGTYYRIGVGYEAPKDPQHSIGISMRYGQSSFRESGTVFLESPSGSQIKSQLTIDRENLSANWWEVVVYTDQKLFKKSDILWIGLNVRLRILKKYDRQEEVDVYAIPGYGRSFDKTIPAANLFLKLKF